MTRAATEGQHAPDTRSRVPDVAERLVRVPGLIGRSHVQVTAKLGATKAAVHDHNTGKTEMGCALIERYAAPRFTPEPRLGTLTNESPVSEAATTPGRVP